MAIRVAQEHGLRVEERPWKLNEAGLTEAMMSSTTNAVMPIHCINEQSIGDGKPGELTMQIRAWMLEAMDALRRA